MGSIALTGPKGSGKGTLCSYITQKYSYTEISFASAVKDVLSATFMWPRHLLEGTTPESRKFRETVDEWWSRELGFEITPRFAMTNIGTDLFRDRFHPDIWALNVKRQLGIKRNVVISDLRFLNEHRVVNDNIDIVVKILPRKTPVWYDIAKRAVLGDEDAQRDMVENFPYVHKSEWEWTAIDADITLRNDKEDLNESFDNLVLPML